MTAARLVCGYFWQLALQKVHIKVHMQGVQVSTDDTLSHLSLFSHCNHSHNTTVDSFGSIMAQNLRTLTLTWAIWNASSDNNKMLKGRYNVWADNCKIWSSCEADLLTLAFHIYVSIRYISLETFCCRNELKNRCKDVRHRRESAHRNIQIFAPLTSHRATFIRQYTEVSLHGRTSTKVTAAEARKNSFVIC